MTDKEAFFKGAKDAFGVFLAYFAVSLALGINCTQISMSWVQAGLMSFLNLTSAGEFAAIEIMENQGSFWELALSQLVINLRYLLMSASLILKISPSESILRRMLIAVGVTDEIYGLSSIQKNPLNPMYTFGCFTVATLGWTAGTVLGAIAGSVLPVRLVSALSFGLYAMFIAIVVPASKKNLIIASLCLLSMLAGWAVYRFLPTVDIGLRVIMITVVLSSVFAFFFPHKEISND